MAVSITSTPNSFVGCFTPAYNLFYWTCTSTNVGQDNFKFIIDVYTGATTATTYVQRYKIQPRFTTSNLVFSPYEIFKNYLSYDFNPSLTGSSVNGNSFLNYTLSFGEEYQVTGTTSGTSIYSGLTQETGATFNGVLQYEEVPSWTPANYFFFTAAKPFFTNQPSSVYIKNTTDRATLSFYNYKLSGVMYTRYKVKTYQESGGTKTFYIANTSCSASTMANINQIGTGIYNLNNISAGNISGYTGYTSVVNINTDYKYEVNLFSNLNSDSSEVQTYLIDKRISKYQTVRFAFLNRLGGFDYFNADFISRKTLNISKNTFAKALPYNYSVGLRGTTVLNSEITETRIANTNWITDTEMIWLQEFFTSPEVYEINSDGTYLPVIVNNSPLEIKKSINDKLFNLTIEYALAYKRNSQTN